MQPKICVISFEFKSEIGYQKSSKPKKVRLVLHENLIFPNEFFQTDHPNLTFIFHDLAAIAAPIPVTPSWKFNMLHWSEASTNTETNANDEHQEKSKGL
jgi:hypothetical protein